LSTLLGARARLLSQGAAPPLEELDSFLVYPGSVTGIQLDATLGAEPLEEALERLADDAEAAAQRAGGVLLVSDRLADEERAPLPSLLALGAVQSRLVSAGLRTRCSLVVEADDIRDSHGCACLLGYGADAVSPRLALETAAALAARDKLGGDHPSP